ncbi:MAG: UbiX family flavin prenyltransferase [Candidatus Thorarchaeota archaeon]|nr:UbiX family flavin prenyltransferase [Candidatus Thorarchaeota archaeon]
MMNNHRYLVCITGASGAIYGVRTIRALKQLGHEVHVIVTKWGARTLQYEMNLSIDDLVKEVDVVYDETDLSAGPASGSFPLDGVVIVPCSMKTLAGVAQGFTDNLVTRAADCAMKERRRLLLVMRETPLNLIHIRNMERVTEAGGIVLPASPAFWHRPRTIEDLVDSVVERVLIHLDAIQTPQNSWNGEHS